MKLYWCEQSCAFRIAWMPREVGQPYERVRVDIRTGDNKGNPDFQAASPMGKVPAISDGPVRLWDSGAICLYIPDKYPEAGLTVPAGDQHGFEFIQWLTFTNSVIEPAMIEKFMSVSPKPESYGYGSFESMISVLEQGLSGKSWIMGERFTAADVLLGFSVHIPDKFGLLPNTATFQDYVVRCRTRPALQTALSWGDPQT